MHSLHIHIAHSMDLIIFPSSDWPYWEIDSAPRQTSWWNQIVTQDLHCQVAFIFREVWIFYFCFIELILFYYSLYNVCDFISWAKRECNY